MSLYSDSWSLPSIRIICIALKATPVPWHPLRLWLTWAGVGPGSGRANKLLRWFWSTAHLGNHWKLEGPSHSVAFNVGYALQSLEELKQLLRSGSYLQKFWFNCSRILPVQVDFIKIARRMYTTAKLRTTITKLFFFFRWGIWVSNQRDKVTCLRSTGQNQKSQFRTCSQM